MTRGPQPAFWGPLATLVWIASRSEELAARAMEKERDQRPAVTDLAAFFSERQTHLKEPDNRFEGLFLDPGIPLAVLAILDPAQREEETRAAMEAVWSLGRELADGARLRGSGRNSGADRDAAIPPSFWTRATAHLPGDNFDADQIVFADHRNLWTDVQFPRGAVKRCWQPFPGGATPRRQVSARVLADWYEARVSAWPSDRQHPSIKDDWEDAKAAFESLPPSRAQVEAVRGAKAPEHWKKRGRRPAVTPNSQSPRT